MLSASRMGEWYGFSVAVGYGFTSISITFINKTVLSLYSFRYSLTMTLVQVVLSIAFLQILKYLKWIEFPSYENSTGKKVFPLSVCFVFMVATGLASLVNVNIPMFNALRRLTTLMVIIGEYVLLSKVSPADEVSSVLLMCFGALVAGSADLTYDFNGYLLAFVSCFCTAAYLIYISKVTKDTGLNTFGLMYYNNVLSIPLLLVLVCYFELNDLKTYPYFQDFGFQLSFILSAIAAFILNYLIFLCSKVNSPLTTSITGQLKVILTTVIGLFAFEDVKINFTFLFGLLLSIIASIWYAVVKFNQMSKRRTELPQITKDKQENE